MFEFLQNSNPLLFVFALMLIYTFLYLVKKDIKQSLLFLAIFFLLALILSPGGQAIADRSKYLSSPEKRAKCLLNSLAAGALWNTEASKKAYCRE